MTGAELMAAHAASFNDGVRSGVWEPMLVRFATDAELVFDGVPAGPFRGVDAIRRAYRDQPPDDEIELLGVSEEDERTAVARYAWRRGGTGRMTLEHACGVIEKLTVAFD